MNVPSVLQTFGLLLISLSVAAVSLIAGGICLGISFLVVGIALERR